MHCVSPRFFWISHILPHENGLGELLSLFSPENLDIILTCPYIWHSLLMICDSARWQLEEFQHFLREGELRFRGQVRVVASLAQRRHHARIWCVGWRAVRVGVRILVCGQGLRCHPPWLVHLCSLPYVTPSAPCWWVVGQRALVADSAMWAKIAYSLSLSLSLCSLVLACSLPNVTPTEREARVGGRIRLCGQGLRLRSPWCCVHCRM